MFSDIHFCGRGVIFDYNICIIYTKWTTKLVVVLKFFETLNLVRIDLSNTRLWFG